MKVFLINIIFILCSIVVRGQQDIHFSYSLQKLIEEEVQLASEMMFKQTMDTSLFSFIPIVMADLRFFKNGYHDHSLLEDKKITLSEVLLISKKNRRIVGSNFLCANGSGTLFFISHKYGINIMTCRSYNRLSYLSDKLYRKLNRIRKREGVKYVLNISELDKIYVVTNSKKVKEISP